MLPALAGAAAAYVLWRFAAEASPVPPRLVVAALPVYLLLWLATVGLHALRWRMVVRRRGTEVPVARLAQCWLAARAVGSVVPSGTLGGEPIRAQLLTASGMPAASAAGAVAIECLHLFELATLFAVFALAVPLPLLLLSSMGIGVAHTVPMPASRGTLEATQIGLFTVGGEPLATGLAVTIAIRLAETLWILVGLACLATAPGWRAQGRPSC